MKKTKSCFLTFHAFNCDLLPTSLDDHMKPKLGAALEAINRH